MPTSQSISHVKRMPRQNLSKPKNVDKKNNNFKWFKTMHAVDHNHPVTKKPTGLHGPMYPLHAGIQY